LGGIAASPGAFTTGVDRQVRVRFVTPGYLASVGTPIIDGLDIARSDDERAGLVVMVNQTLARRLSAQGALVGRAVKFAVRDFNIRGLATPWQVIGVVADSRDSGPRAAVQAEIYLPMSQGPSVCSRSCCNLSPAGAASSQSASRSGRHRDDSARRSCCFTHSWPLRHSLIG
jgi:hypothetical protein